MGQWISKKTHLRLVQNWRSAWRWISVQSMALAAALQLGWASLDAELRSSIPGEWVTGLTVAILVFGALGRLVQQTPVQDKVDARAGAEADT